MKICLLIALFLLAAVMLSDLSFSTMPEKTQIETLARPYCDQFKGVEKRSCEICNERSNCFYYYEHGCVCN